MAKAKLLEQSDLQELVRELKKLDSFLNQIIQFFSKDSQSSTTAKREYKQMIKVLKSTKELMGKEIGWFSHLDKLNRHIKARLKGK